MYDISHDLLDSLQATPIIFETLLRGVSQKQALASRGGDEGWSVVEVVCHLRDAEEQALARMRAMRDADNPLLAAYDQDEWARDRDYAAADLREALAAFLQLRAQHVGELAALSPGAWERTGQHEEQGIINVMAHTQHIATHDAVHAAQIARQLQ